MTKSPIEAKRESGAVASAPKHACACKADDRYDCWAIRYGRPQNFYCQIDIDMDGGPCECSCHDEQDCNPNAPHPSAARRAG